MSDALRLPEGVTLDLPEGVTLDQPEREPPPVWTVDDDTWARLPENVRARLESTMLLSKAMRVPMSQAEVYEGAIRSQNERTAKNPVKFRDYLWNSLRNGVIEEIVSPMYFQQANQVVSGDITGADKVTEDIKEWENKKVFVDPRELGWFEQRTGEVVGMLPGLAQFGVRSVVGGMAGASAAVLSKAAMSSGISGALAALGLGQAGPQALVPEEIATVPLAFGVAAAPAVAAGWQTGAAIATTAYSAKRAFAGTWRDLSAIKDANGNDIDPVIRYGAALVSGLGQGFVERMQFTSIMKAFPGAEKLFGEASRRAITTMQKSGAFSRVMQTVVAVGTRAVARTAPELAEEVFQKTIDVYMQEFAKGMSNLTGGTEFTVDQREAMRQIAGELNSWGSLLLLSVAGETMTGVRDFATTERARSEGQAFKAWMESGEYVMPDIDPNLVEGVTPTDGDIAADLSLVEGTEMVRKWREKRDKRLVKNIWPDLDAEHLPQAIRDFRELKVSQLAGGLEDTLEAGGTGRGAIRRAIAAGKKEQKSSQQYVDAAAKEMAAEREYVLKLSDSIMREPAGNVDLDYSLMIEMLQGQLDPKFRAAKTLAARQKTREFLLRNPEWELPKKVLDIIAKKSLNEITVDDLEDMAAFTASLRIIGKKKFELKKSAEARQFVADRDDAVASIKKTRVTEETVDVSAIEADRPELELVEKEGFFRKAGGAIARYTFKPPRIARILDGGEEGANSRIFVDRVNTAYDAEVSQGQTRHEQMPAKLKELGLRHRDLSKTRDVEGQKYTVDEMLTVYAAMKNERAKALLIAPEGGIATPKGRFKFTEDGAKKVIAALTDKEKAIGDWIIGEYGVNYQRLRLSLKDYNNTDLGFEESYFPIERLLGNNEKPEEIQDELARRLLIGSNLRKGYVERGMTKPRYDIAPENQTPMRAGLVQQWYRQVGRQEHFINSGKLVKDLIKLADSKEWKEAVRENVGEEYVKEIQNYVNRVGDPDIYRQQRGLDQVIRVLRGNRSLRHLAFNPKVALKQATSAAFYLPYTGSNFVQSSANLLAANHEFMEDPYAMMDFVAVRDPQFGHSSIERELEEARSLGANSYEKVLATIGKPGYALLRGLDKYARAVGWKASYDYGVHQGMDDAEATRYAQKATLDTQPAASAKDQAEIYATSEWMNWALQFTSQINQVWNMIAADMPAAYRRATHGGGGKDITMMALFAAGIAIDGALIWMIDKRRMPEDEKDLLEMATDPYVDAIPLIGSAVMSSREGYSGMQIPGVELAASIAELYRRKPWEQKTGVIVKELLGVAGAPVTTFEALRKTIESEDPSYLIGGPPRR